MGLYFEETGKKNEETIIFLHGGGLAGWMWDEPVKAFPDYHCIVPDLPEHGLSAEVKPFTIECAAKMVVDLIRTRAHEDKAHLVGLSLGAQIIVQILSRAPEVVDHALISGTLVRGLPHKDTLLKLLDYTFKVYEPVKDTDFFIKANMRTYNISKKKYFSKFKESTLQIKAESLHRILHENMFFKIPNGLEKVNVPVMVMVGEKDYKVIRESARDLWDVFGNSQAYMVPKLGHVWNMESPELFNQVLRGWITEKSLPDVLRKMKFNKNEI